MKTQKLVSIVITCLFMIGIAIPMQAQETGENRNLFETAGEKQTETGFKPAPDKIETNFGTLNFELEAFPDEASVQKIYDEMDRQRATQAYMDFYPTLSVNGILKGQIRDFGFKTASDVGVMPGPGLTPSELYLTGNNSTVYAVATLDLKVDGATVVEIPAGMYGTADDAAFKFLTDIGFVGPDKGKGGKYLFVPPGYTDQIPDGYFVIKSPSYRIWTMMRGWGDIGSGEKALDYFRQNLKIYPLTTGPREFKVVNTNGLGLNSLPAEDGSVFELLNEVIQYEPSALFGAEQLGKLATLGIRKGEPFNPDARMQKILDQGAKLGAAMCRAIVFASREKDIEYWEGRHWEKMFLYNTTFERDGVADVDARTLWHYPAIVVSPALIATTPGAGTAYLTSFRDKDGAYLDGGKNYKLTVSANPPVKNFWAVTAYDPTTRSLLDTGDNFNKSVGSRDNPEVNADGSVDVYFGAKAPKGKEKNWVPTNAEKGFFVVFRFYGPEEGYINKTWVLNDFELIK
ncbi:MAG: DUF1254 domain-containing protein [Eudoraea sp.]|uniref:DUF1254 domain-containing protein n=1 Tax=Eudoraea sp. TaxID=1979955 RepID=UPI003C78A5D5